MMKAHLFNGLKFKTDMAVYEDDWLIWSMLGKINKMVQTNVASYHIIVHSGSITNQSYKDSRFACIMKFWNKICADCSSGELAYLKKDAEKGRLKRYGDDFAFMTSCGFYNPDFDRIICKTLRSGGITSIKVQRDLPHKVFIMCAMLSPKLARKLLKLLGR